MRRSLSLVMLALAAVVLGTFDLHPGRKNSSQIEKSKAHADRASRPVKADAPSDLKLEGNTVSDDGIRMPMGEGRIRMLLAALGPEWLPKTAEQLSEDAGKFLEEYRRRTADSELFEDEATLSQACLSRVLPRACAQLLQLRRRSLSKNEDAIEKMPEGSERQKLLASVESESSYLAAISAESCILGISDSCSYGFSKFASVLTPQMKRYCEKGYGYYCSTLAEEVLDRDHDEAVNLYSQGCHQDDFVSCESLLSSKLLPDTDPHRIEALENFEARCARGDDEERWPSGCQTLARYYADGRDTDRALDYADQSCNRGYSGSCLLEAELALTGGYERDVVADAAMRACATRASGTHFFVDNNEQLCQALANSETFGDREWQLILGMRTWTGSGERTLGQTLQNRAPASASASTDDP